MFNISQDNYIVLGSSLARELGVGVGEEINLLVLSGGNDVSLFSNDRKFIVTGIFTSGYAEVNSSFCFVNLVRTLQLYVKPKRLSARHLRTL